MNLLVIPIQSVTDVVTNSSSEIFVIYRKSDFEFIKELINELLKLVDSNKTFDDLFELKIWTTEEAEEDYVKSGSSQDFIDWCMDKDLEINIDERNPYIESYTIDAKSEEAKSVAYKLSNLAFLFEKVESFR